MHGAKEWDREGYKDRVRERMEREIKMESEGGERKDREKICVFIMLAIIQFFIKIGS